MSTTLSAEAALCLAVSDGKRICRMTAEEQDHSGSGDRDITWENTGNNRLSGGFGDDILYGAEGDDWLIGDSGNVLLSWGAWSVMKLLMQVVITSFTVEKEMILSPLNLQLQKSPTSISEKKEMIYWLEAGQSIPSIAGLASTLLLIIYLNRVIISRIIAKKYLQEEFDVNVETQDDLAVEPKEPEVWPH